MIDQVRAVLATYRSRVALQVYALAVVPILVFSYFMFSALPGRSVIAYLALVNPAAAIFFAFLGEHMKMQFASWRAKLSPDYVLPHFIAAFVLTASVGVLVFAISLAFYRAIPPHLSMASLAALWTLCLLAFSAGYFFRPEVIYLLLMAVMLSATLARWVLEMDRLTAVLVLAADLVLSVALVKRMLSGTEEEWEYRYKDSREESQRYLWTRLSKRTWWNRLRAREQHVLDRPRPLAGDAIAQVRHFAAGMQMYQSFLIMTVMLVVAFWPWAA